MANGMYTCPKRVVRDGFLVAFEGEVMTMDEAAERGLSPAAGGEPAEKTKGELAARAEALGLKVPSRATKKDIEQLIAEAEAGVKDPPADEGESEGE